MKYLLLTFLFLAQLAGSSQSSNMVFFTENGEFFTVFVNGARQNNVPAAQVKAIGFAGDFANVRVVFASPEIPEIKQGLMVEQGMESTYIIKRNKKGEMVMRFSGSAAIPVGVVETQSVQTTVNVPQNQNINTNPSGTVVTTTTTTTTTGDVDEEGGGIGINISDGQGGGVNMNVNLNLGGIKGAIQNSGITTHSTTTTTYSETYTESYGDEGDDRDHQHARDNGRGREEVREDRFVHPSGCPGPMLDADYNRAVQSISSKSFSDQKFTILTQVLNANCVTVNQVIGFMKLFTFEDDKLEVAKKAYTKTWDQGNYYQVNDAFTYSTSTDELNKFIQSIH